VCQYGAFLLLYFMAKKDLLTSEKELKKIGLRLKNLRKSSGYTSPDKFSYENNLNRSQYGKYEAGSTNITIGSLVNILNCFGISLSDFFNNDYEGID
jgi:transcriptional regulator with XRE-family HTH domain